MGYRYGARALSGPADLRVDTLWVAGGLYGNRFALDRLLELYDREPESKALVFNGDFHWFDIDPQEFRYVNGRVLEHRALRGNVETELAIPATGAGCGCGYPDWVDDETVARSNRIMERLRSTARALEGGARLGSLPMYLVAEVGDERIGVVHGDADSLAGWGFSQEVLSGTAGAQAAREACAQADVLAFASSHSCLPVLQRLDSEHAIINNGAAGMPDFDGTQFGLATRISVRPGPRPLYRMRLGRLWLEAVPLEYDSSTWMRAFLSQWPVGSDAHKSYFERIARGPRYPLERALRALDLVCD
jgi:hypothetical protein